MILNIDELYPLLKYFNFNSSGITLFSYNDKLSFNWVSSYFITDYKYPKKFNGQDIRISYALFYNTLRYYNILGLSVSITKDYLVFKDINKTVIIKLRYTSKMPTTKAGAVTFTNMPFYKVNVEDNILKCDIEDNHFNISLSLPSTIRNILLESKIECGMIGNSIESYLVIKFKFNSTIYYQVKEL